MNNFTIQKFRGIEADRLFNLLIMFFLSYSVPALHLQLSVCYIYCEARSASESVAIVVHSASHYHHVQVRRQPNLASNLLSYISGEYRVGALNDPITVHSGFNSGTELQSLEPDTRT